MKGNAHCSFQSNPHKSERFENVNLTFLGNEREAILSRDHGEEPEELLCLEEARLDILSDSLLNLEGYVCTDQETNTFYPCSVIFSPVCVNKEVA